MGPGTFAKLATASWVELGAGPMAVQSTTTNVLIAIADSTPGTSFAGFCLSPKKVLSYAGNSNVWIALRPGSVAAGRGGAVRYAWLNQILLTAETQIGVRGAL